MRWKLDAELAAAIQAAPAQIRAEGAQFEGGALTVDSLGGDALKTAGVSPNAVAQLVLHRAFFLVTGRLPDGAADVIHRRRFRGGRYAFATVTTPAGDAWARTGQGIRTAARELRACVAEPAAGPDLFSTAFAVTAAQCPGPMRLRARVRWLSDSLTAALPPLRTVFWPEVLCSNMSGLRSLGHIGPVTQRPGGLMCVHRVEPDRLTWYLWWSDHPGRMDALLDGLQTAADEAFREL